MAQQPPATPPTAARTSTSTFSNFIFTEDEDLGLQSMMFVPGCEEQHRFTLTFLSDDLESLFIQHHYRNHAHIIVLGAVALFCTIAVTAFSPKYQQSPYILALVVPALTFIVCIVSILALIHREPGLPSQLRRTNVHREKRSTSRYQRCRAHEIILFGMLIAVSIPIVGFANDYIGNCRKYWDEQNEPTHKRHCLYHVEPYLFVMYLLMLAFQPRVKFIVPFCLLSLAAYTAIEFSVDVGTPTILSVSRILLTFFFVGGVLFASYIFEMQSRSTLLQMIAFQQRMSEWKERQVAVEEILTSMMPRAQIDTLAEAATQSNKQEEHEDQQSGSGHGVDSGGYQLDSMQGIVVEVAIGGPERHLVQPEHMATIVGKLDEVVTDFDSAQRIGLVGQGYVVVFKVTVDSGQAGPSVAGFGASQFIGAVQRLQLPVYYRPTSSRGSCAVTTVLGVGAHFGLIYGAFVSSQYCVMGPAVEHAHWAAQIAASLSSIPRSHSGRGDPGIITAALITEATSQRITDDINAHNASLTAAAANILNTAHVPPQQKLPTIVPVDDALLHRATLNVNDTFHEARTKSAASEPAVNGSHRNSAKLLELKPVAEGGPVRPLQAQQQPPRFANSVLRRGMLNLLQQLTKAGSPLTQTGLASMNSVSDWVNSTITAARSTSTTNTGATAITVPASVFSNSQKDSNTSGSGNREKNVTTVVSFPKDMKTDAPPQVQPPSPHGNPLQHPPTRPDEGSDVSSSRDHQEQQGFLKGSSGDGGNRRGGLSLSIAPPPSHSTTSVGSETKSTSKNSVVTASHEKHKTSTSSDTEFKKNHNEQQHQLDVAEALDPHQHQDDLHFLRSIDLRLEQAPTNQDQNEQRCCACITDSRMLRTTVGEPYIYKDVRREFHEYGLAATELLRKCCLLTLLAFVSVGIFTTGINHDFETVTAIAQPLALVCLLVPFLARFRPPVWHQHTAAACCWLVLGCFWVIHLLKTRPSMAVSSISSLWAVGSFSLWLALSWSPPIVCLAHQAALCGLYMYIYITDGPNWEPNTIALMIGVQYTALKSHGMVIARIQEEFRAHYKAAKTLQKVETDGRRLQKILEGVMPPWAVEFLMSEMDFGRSLRGTTVYREFPNSTLVLVSGWAEVCNSLPLTFGTDYTSVQDKLSHVIEHAKLGGFLVVNRSALFTMLLLPSSTSDTSHTESYASPCTLKPGQCESLVSLLKLCSTMGLGAVCQQGDVSLSLMRERRLTFGAVGSTVSALHTAASVLWRTPHSSTPSRHQSKDGCSQNVWICEATHGQLSASNDVFLDQEKGKEERQIKCRSGREKGQAANTLPSSTIIIKIGDDDYAARFMQVIFPLLSKTADDEQEPKEKTSGSANESCSSVGGGLFTIV